MREIIPYFFDKLPVDHVGTSVYYILLSLISYRPNSYFTMVLFRVVTKVEIESVGNEVPLDRILNAIKNSRMGQMPDADLHREFQVMVLYNHEF